MEEEKNLTDLEMLEDLKQKIHKGLNYESVKIGDLLKVIDMKNKLSVTGKAEKKFWDMIDELRRETLPGGSKPAKKKQKRTKKES
ncbi:MAG: hypothetical protein CVT49_08405 [candidate division Zixibacteria bacterium HGW-Zixibacteria-1]|nr:MAG: hypothetical protein CVT49_08405 [candidate division Zixibacteria bacterium HGW-Zixibacteria-1]